MNAAAKIRWLLALICVSLFLTAIIAKNSYSPRNNLDSSAKTLESRLHQKEMFARSFIDDKTTFIKLKNIDNNEQYALDLIDLLKTEKLYITTYRNNELTYWNGVRILPNNVERIKEGSSFIKESNGYYEAIKKTEGNFCAILFIPVKNSYSYQNEYLQNTFSPELLHDNNIDIADFTDQNVYAIHTCNNSYLFSVKLKANNLNRLFIFVQLLLWISGILLLCVLINSLANYVAGKGYPLGSFAIIIAFIGVLRFINLHYHWPDIYQGISLFNPAYYSWNEAFPSLGDFVVNLVLLVWLALFVYNTRSQIIVKPVESKFLSYTILLACTLFLLALSYALLNIFGSLVLHSNINFDVNNVLNLTSFSIVGVVLLCLGFFVFILFAETCLVISSNLNLSKQSKISMFAALIILATLIEAYFYKDISGFYILWGLIILIRGYAIAYDKGKFSPLMYIAIIVVCSTISSIKLYSYQSVKEKDTRKILVKKLESAEDQSAEYLFKQIEEQLVNARFLIDYFDNTTRNHNYLKSRFQKLYFNGYLSKYDFKTYEYDKDNKPLSGNGEFDLNNFKDMVLYSAFKVGGTKYFYKINSAFGFQSYFAIIPISSDTDRLGTIVIELKSKPLKSAEPFPELLIEDRPLANDQFKGYSYAFYSDGKLLNQSGKYTYSLANYEFAGKLKQYIYKTSVGKPSYSHLIYQPTDRKLIVVSKEDDKIYIIVTSLTFFFLVYLAFVFILLGIEWLWLAYKNFDKVKSWSWNFWESFDKVLYKTRIQLSMVFAVVITLLIIGVLTFLSVSSQYQNQQDDFIHDKISRIAVAFEKINFEKNLITSNEDMQLNFNSFADTYSSDLTLFDKDGIPIFTTQPKLYETGLIAPRMNARAFIYLNKLQKSNYVNEETIGSLNYKAAYAPVRSSKNDVIGFLQLPYFSNETEYRERIGAFLNTMINVYALVFIAIGLFAILVARQITTPLTLIQQSLSKTIYGRKNEPIKWQHNDEIGSLIKEYNNMIAALENSAQKLAQSERENAWREMAKQVAHEIKNPLTPLKLGLQLLEKSWKDKDPKFDAKFERFSKSFVEQIDSLSKIASEFSNFAKMPETRLERFNIFEIISQATTIFKQTDNFRIIFNNPNHQFFVLADKDQILRSFNNLLKNAIEAVPADRQGVVEISHHNDGKHVYITIKDNGNGIPEALRERIFVPNFTTKSSGTGLGLALVKNAIEYAGGSISFDTELQVGTTFYISFPAAS
ncbi:sensor histidine kinase [Mucilaginibacter paludis]|uniref:histidine kinase n=1 Tax=Mucilaginibacter paludis DSM 18603 TaxID=714943 RepID=H1YIP2_9SPHI|nr:HAMP domain-containing sensor histidine kinase [Mucilaginibacter paludis]EHQ27587.1 integral membrane sensor signal transduction histidine kinase [Mucilaginibacter paludis DSM 18603]